MGHKKCASCDQQKCTHFADIDGVPLMGHKKCASCDQQKCTHCIDCPKDGVIGCPKDRKIGPRCKDCNTKYDTVRQQQLRADQKLQGKAKKTAIGVKIAVPTIGGVIAVPTIGGVIADPIEDGWQQLDSITVSPTDQQLQHSPPELGPDHRSLRASSVPAEVGWQQSDSITEQLSPQELGLAHLSIKASSVLCNLVNRWQREEPNTATKARLQPLQALADLLQSERPPTRAARASSCVRFCCSLISACTQAACEPTRTQPATSVYVVGGDERRRARRCSKC